MQRLGENLVMLDGTYSCIYLLFFFHDDLKTMLKMMNNHLKIHTESDTLMLTDDISVF